jgi:hypothetical protein
MFIARVRPIHLDSQGLVFSTPAKAMRAARGVRFWKLLEADRDIHCDLNSD